jgi:hypothetical protein
VSSYEKNGMQVSECSRFSLDTGLRSASLVAVSDKRATYMVADSLSTILYTYDFEKMERYMIDLTSYGREYSVYGAGDNIILYQSTGKRGTYVIPELGAAFEIFKADYEPGKDYVDDAVYKLHNIITINGKTVVVEQSSVNDVYYSNGEITDNIPTEEEYIGKNSSCLNKVYILNE